MPYITVRPLYSGLTQLVYAGKRDANKKTHH
ncbi:hypothetical protein UNH65_16530 [Chitinophaga sp. 180180018-2]|nr:hypothetical protein [Chitinophaga sp. 212800010-3]